MSIGINRINSKSGDMMGDMADMYDYDMDDEDYEAYHKAQSYGKCANCKKIKKLFAKIYLGWICLDCYHEFEHKHRGI